MNLSMKCAEFLDILTTSEEARELVIGETIYFLLGCKLYSQVFDSMIGILLSEIPPDERNSGVTMYRKVGTGEIKIEAVTKTKAN